MPRIHTNIFPFCWFMQLLSMPAFVQALPSTTTFVEGEYGSTLELNIMEGDRRSSAVERNVWGFYCPPVQELEGDGDCQAAKGRSELHGSIKPDKRDPNYCIVTGTWQHIDGLMCSGTFAMRIHGTSQVGRGWYTVDDVCADESLAGLGSGIRYEWNWGKIESSGITKVIDESGACTVPSKEKVHCVLFFRDLVAGVWMSRYSVLTAWTFLFITVAQLGLACAQVSHVTVVWLNFAANLYYSSIYVSFLVAYLLMRTKPGSTYIWGVLLYTIGYIFFVVLYGLVLAEESTFQFSAYVLGSMFFLVGSVSLVHATWPEPRSLYAAPSKVKNKVCVDFRGSPISFRSSLWWGSMLFLLGSIVFTVDSVWQYGEPVNAVLGYLLFTPGRWYFLWGSTTPKCGFLLFNSSKKPTNRRPNASSLMSDKERALSNTNPMSNDVLVEMGNVTP